MFVAGLFSFFFRFTLLCMGIGAAGGVNRGEWRAGVILLAVITLWNWRWILDYVAERRWRFRPGRQQPVVLDSSVEAIVAINIVQRQSR